MAAVEERFASVSEAEIAQQEQNATPKTTKCHDESKVSVSMFSGGENKFENCVFQTNSCSSVDLPLIPPF